MTRTNSYDYYDGEVSGVTVYEPESVKMSSVLDKNGKPYAVVSRKNPIGFDLSSKK